MSSNPYADLAIAEAEFDQALYRLASALPRDEIGVENAFRAVWQLWGVLKADRSDLYGERLLACARLLGDVATARERILQYRQTGDA